MITNVTHNFTLFDDSKGFSAGNAFTKTSTLDSRIQQEATSSSVNENSPKENWSFWDFLDVINPLQHIPILNTLYREWTGDEIKAPARIAGGALFGGIGGAATSIVNAIVEETTGQDIGNHVLALFDDQTPPATQQTTPYIQLAKARDPSTNQESILESAPEPVIEIFAQNFVDHQGNIILASIEPKIDQWTQEQASSLYQKASQSNNNF